jgi:CheY-like chemotaxis protein
MTKIMLVEDDKSLREIYGVRLLAEGYDIVSAADGEEALAMAIKERPKLIISDVMMPKISGFDMLDILRSTTETKDIKVIMMTALSSEDQRQRGEQLGADRYLVKSQVGIEDVIRVVHEVLGDQAGGAMPATAPAQSAAPAPVSQTPPAPAPPRPSAPAMSRPAASFAPTPRPVVSAPQPPVYTPPAPAAPTPPNPVSFTPTPMPSPAVAAPAPNPMPATPPAPQSFQPSQSSVPPAPSVKNRVIQPLNDPGTAKVDINELLDRELAKEAGIDVDSNASAPSPEPVPSTPTPAPASEPINQFTPQSPLPSTPPAQTSGSDEPPTIQIDANGRVIMPSQAPSQNNPGATPPSQPV